MNQTQDIQLLPKVEVSFQDDFGGDDREFTLTPKYILKELSKIGSTPEIGIKILLWEKDEGEDGKDYLCNIGEISKNENISSNSPSLNNQPIIITLDRDAFFRLKNI